MLSLGACSFGTEEKQVDTEIEPATVKSIVDYRIESIDEQMGPCTGTDTLKRCLTFQVEYPVVTGGISDSLHAKLNQNILSDITNSYFLSEEPVNFEDLKSNLQSDFEGLLKDFPDYENNWSVEVISDILHQDSLFISVATTITSYTGGAHSNYMQSYRSYDLRTGEAVTLDDLFNPGYKEELNQVAEIEFRMDKEIPPEESLQEQGYWFENDRFQLNQNFAVINKSLVFYFNAYEIAPYAMGPTELELKLTDFVDLIKDGSIIESYQD